LTGTPSNGRRLTGSRAWLIKLFGDIRASYWFLPALCVLVAHLIAAVTLRLDLAHPVFVDTLPTAFPETRIAGARGLLTLMASSVIGVTGVMFSTTMVAVSFASGNFGPRLVGNFMRDRGTQWSLGILIGTFAFCLQILRAVHGGDDGSAFVPQLSLNAALALTLLSVLVMIYFVHHVPETINVSNISAAVGHRLEACIRKEIDRGATDEASLPVPDGAPMLQPCLARSGYIQSLDGARLRQLAQAQGWHILLRAQPGDFVTAEMPVLEVHAATADAPPDEAQRKALRACFALGDERTEDQNPTFLVDQLVEMTARAMSSGVNDPFTAIDCLNRMFAALDLALNCEDGLPHAEKDAIGQRNLTFALLLDRSFRASLPYVAEDPMARTHMRDLIARLRPSARTTREIEALTHLAQRLDSEPAA
jgi:uncharacterized membrane protein